MGTRSGFARLLPLMALAGFAAGTVLPLAGALAVRPPAPTECAEILVPTDDPGDDRPMPARDMVDADGRRWEVADIPGHTLRGLHLRHAEWAGVDLHGATFVDCDFRGCDLRDADLRDVQFDRCRLEGASLEGANFGHFVIFNFCWVRGAHARGHSLGYDPPRDGDEWNVFALVPDKRDQLNEALRSALARFDAPAVRTLVRKGADPATRIPNDLSPLSRRSNYPTVLMLGVLLDDTKFVRDVLATGTDVDGADGDGWTPLMIASALGEPKLVKFLLSRGANPNLIANAGVTALGLAEGAGRQEVAVLLRKAGAKAPPVGVHYLVRRLGTPGEVNIPGGKVTAGFGKDTCVRIAEGAGVTGCCIGHRTCANSLAVEGVRIHLRGGLFLIEYHDQEQR